MAKTGARFKGLLKNTATGSVKEFMFNFPSFSDSKGVDWGEIKAPASSVVMTEYLGAVSSTLPITLYLNGTPEEVKGWVAWLNDFLPYRVNGVDYRPPTMVFAFGWYVKTCVLNGQGSLSVEYTRFTELLEPTEAKVTLNLRVV